MQKNWQNENFLTAKANENRRVKKINYVSFCSLDKVDNEKLILERCISLEKDIQSDRRQMQQVIDAKQRLIEKQVSS